MGKLKVANLPDRVIFCLWRLLEAIWRSSHPFHTHPDHVSAQFNHAFFPVQGVVRIYSYSGAKI
jgi:hypothetical protein